MKKGMESGSPSPEGGGTNPDVKKAQDLLEAEIREVPPQAVVDALQAPLAAGETFRGRLEKSKNPTLKRLVLLAAALSLLAVGIVIDELRHRYFKAERAETSDTLKPEAEPAGLPNIPERKTTQAAGTHEQRKTPEQERNEAFTTFWQGVDVLRKAANKQEHMDIMLAENPGTESKEAMKVFQRFQETARKVTELANRFASKYQGPKEDAKAHAAAGFLEIMRVSAYAKGYGSLDKQTHKKGVEIMNQALAEGDYKGLVQVYFDNGDSEAWVVAYQKAYPGGGDVGDWAERFPLVAPMLAQLQQDYQSGAFQSHDLNK